MSLDRIKIEFLDYLLEKEIISEDQKLDIDMADISIFAYFDEFKDFLVEENYADSDIFYKTLDEVQDMEYINGELVDTEETNEDEDVNEENEEINESEEDEDILKKNSISLLNEILQDESMIKGLDTDGSGDLDTSEVTTYFKENEEEITEEGTEEITEEGTEEITEEGTEEITEEGTEEITEESTEETPKEKDALLEEIYTDEAVLKYLDEDNDGKLSDEEKAKFEAYVKGDSEELTAEALQKAYDSIKDGTFDIEGYKNFKIPETTEQTQETPETEETQKTEETSEPKNTEKPDKTGGSGGGGGGNYSQDFNNNNNNTEQNKSYDKMSESELKSELSTANTELGSAKDEYSAIMDGSNKDLADAKTELDDLYKEYQTQLKEVDEEMASQLDEIVGKISDQENEISKKEAEITEQELVVDNAKTEHENAVANTAKYKDVYDSLCNVDTKELTPEQKNELDTKKTNAKQAWDEAKEKEKTAKDKVTEEEDKLKTLKETDLKELEDHLKELNTEKDTLEKEIAEKHPEVAQAQKNYNDAKQTYDTGKATMAANAKEKISSAEAKVKEIQTALNNLETNKEIKEKDLKFSTAGDYWGDDVEYNSEYIEHNGVLPYLAITPKDFDPNKPTAVIVGLHGSGEFGHNEKSLRGSSLPYALINGQLRNKADINLENANVVYLFPQAPSGTWTTGDRLTQVDNVITDFASTYKGGVNIDEDHIALLGHSMGGMGAAYFAEHYNNSSNLKHKLSKVAILSGFNSNFNLNNIKSNGIPIRAYVGNSDSSGSLSFTNGSFAKVFGKENTFVVNSGHGSVPEHAYNIDSDQNGRSDLIEWLLSDE